MCVPNLNQGPGVCEKMDIFNVHALPEEDRVVIIFWRFYKIQGKQPPKLNFTEQFKCVFDGSPRRRIYSVPIKYRDVKYLDVDFSYVTLGDCHLPSWSKRSLLLGKEITITVTSANYLGLTRRDDYQVRISPRPVGAKKLLGMCGATPLYGLNKM